MHATGKVKSQLWFGEVIIIVHVPCTGGVVRRSCRVNGSGIFVTTCLHARIINSNDIL